MKVLKKALALFLTLALVAGLGAVTAFADEAADEPAPAGGAGYFKGAFYYRSGSSSGDAVDTYVYSDDYFRTSSTEYNAHLASMSMAVAEASMSSSREANTTTGYTRKSRDLTALLEDIGFSDIAVNDAYRKKPTKDSIGVACAHKQITENGRSYTLLAIIPRSGGYESELGSNFLVGTSGDASGYAAAATKALTFARSYITDKGLSDDIKVWTAGYDRGAAVVNLTAKRLIDDPGKNLGTAVSLTPENLYAYTFGTPNTADAKQKPNSEKYSVIYNHISDTDILSVIPPTEMGLSRYGTDCVINAKANKKRMKQLLEICDPAIYADYVSKNDPALFKTKRVTSTFSIVNDASSYIPSDLSEYLRGESKYISQFNGGRSGYSNGVEKPLTNLLTYYGSLTPEKATAFTETLASDKDTINGIFSLYAYYMRLQSSGTASTSAHEDNAKELAAVSALSDSSEFTEKELYELMLRVVRYMRATPDTILTDAAKYLKNVLTSAMKASGATTTQISSLTATSDLKTLSRFLAFLLFGNIWQSGEADPYDFSNQQIKNAVTLLENAELLLANHKNELLISWLRAADSYYDDYAALTDAQSAGYRRVYLSASDNASLNGEVLDADGEKIAEISGGVLINSADPWLGFTATDEGGFIRVPAGADFRINLSADAAYSLDVTIGEYDCAKAQTATALQETHDVTENATVTVDLPANAAYAVTVTVPEPMKLLGDANADGEVTVPDATVIQRYLAEIETEIDEEAADADGDGEVTILDAAFIQRWLADIDCPYAIGEGVIPANRTD